jgi:hypothetical protein
MMQIRSSGTLLLVAFLSLSASGCRSSSSVPTTEEPSPPSVSGWEIYALRSRCLGAWNFALVEATNHPKTTSQVFGAALEPESFLRRLELLSAGDTLSWTPFPPAGRATSESVPSGILGRISAVATARGVTIAGTPTTSGVL